MPSALPADNYADRPLPSRNLDELKIYVPGKSHMEGVANPHRLASNESALGTSPRALAALKNFADLERYPPGDAIHLRQALARRHDLSTQHIICGNGSDELLELVARAYLAPGDEAIYSQYGFLVYRNAILGAGGAPVIAPEKNYTADIDALLDKVSGRTKLIYLANPNNPTGTYLDREQINRLHRALPAGILLVLDAAYGEYVRRADYECGIELARNCKNILVTRTFSKIYGLASLRLGWAFGDPSIIEALNRLRGPFNVNAIAQAAGLAALDDQPFLDNAYAHNEKWRAYLYEQITQMGLYAPPSIGNFLLVDFSKISAAAAQDAELFLAKRGCLLRNMAAYQLPHCLRLSVGSQRANEDVAAALREFCAENQL